MKATSLASILLAIALAPVAPASADVLIESSGTRSGTTRVVIGDDMARIDRSGASIHVLIDLERQRILAVNDAERYAMDMRSPMPRPGHGEHGELDTSAVPPPEVKLERRKDGPRIAGYATVHYRVTVDGRHCFDEFLAPAALEEPAIVRFLETMAAGSQDEEHRMLIQLTDPGRLCEAAEDLIDDHYPTLGMPMRTLDDEARVIHEITRVDRSAPHDAGIFRLPADYELLTRTEVMQRAQEPEPDAGSLEERQRNIDRHMRDFFPEEGAVQ